MHIHGNQANLNAINPYSAAAEKALSAQRATNVRKNLRKQAAAAQGAPNAVEETLLGGRLTHAAGRGGVEHHSAETCKDSDFG